MFQQNLASRVAGKAIDNSSRSDVQLRTAQSVRELIERRPRFPIKVSSGKPAKDHGQLSSEQQGANETYSGPPSEAILKSARLPVICHSVLRGLLLTGWLGELRLETSEMSRLTDPQWALEALTKLEEARR